MPDYQESAVAGTRWVRCGYLGVNNPRPHLGDPSVTFVEEEVIALGDGRELITPLGNLVEPVNAGNLGESFDLLHPETGAVLGQMTYQDLYVALASAYRHVAGKRDQAATEPPLELPAE
ncbi:hypothetical protein [Metapseudomonas furukawaii]|uniref:Uncharacterized protein n=1 Tax=Metapseudomonas furukawaii TaxID=1149133 RepID=A0AAD1C5P9_METFU|nr:hypothetical protein [Pseudomonas furukawaii]ELS25692.1 hypothetical protein ppKF707_0788 [Pseudomonas furukawaii]BAU76119.1 hypothetical protein KF707C_44310 [Pseudomonas furukawaii]